MKDPQAGMDYHELQVKSVYCYKRDFKLIIITTTVNCAINQSQPAESAGKHITSKKARENTQPPKKMKARENT